LGSDHQRWGFRAIIKVCSIRFFILLNGSGRSFEFPADGMGQFRCGAQSLGRHDKSHGFDFGGPFDVIGGMVIVVMNPMVQAFQKPLGFGEFPVNGAVRVGVVVVAMVMLVTHG
jgi:hypothetical protein